MSILETLNYVCIFGGLTTNSPVIVIGVLDPLHTSGIIFICTLTFSWEENLGDVN